MQINKEDHGMYMLSPFNVRIGPVTSDTIGQKNITRSHQVNAVEGRENIWSRVCANS